MPIVFDQVDGVVEPSAQAHGESAASTGQQGHDGPDGGAPAMPDIEGHLARAQRRHQRLQAD